MTSFYDIMVVAAFSDGSAAETIIATISVQGVPVEITLTPERTVTVMFEERTSWAAGEIRTVAVTHENRMVQL